MSRRQKTLQFNPDKNYTVMGENSLKQVTSLNRIYRKVDTEGCSAEALDALKDDISVVAAGFGISPRAVVLLAAILEKTNSNCGIDKEDLAMYLGCSNIEFIECNASLYELMKKGIVRSGNGPHKTFRVTDEAYKAIENDAEFVPPKTVGLTSDELFSCFRGCFYRFRNGRRCPQEDLEVDD